MSKHEFDYVIVGGGLAASSAVDGIREIDEEGTIAVLAAEEDAPYHRPPLSKEYMQAPEAPRDLLHIKPTGWYDDQPGLSLLTGVQAGTVEDADTVNGRVSRRLYQLASGLKAFAPEQANGQASSVFDSSENHSEGGSV